MPYAVTLRRRAQRDLAQLPPGDYERVRAAPWARAAVPQPSGCIELAGREGWCIRVGDYRVIYGIDDQQRAVTVLQTRHRRDAYRRSRRPQPVPHLHACRRRRMSERMLELAPI